MTNSKIIRPCPRCGRHTLVQYEGGSVYCVAEKCPHNWKEVAKRDE